MHVRNGYWWALGIAGVLYMLSKTDVGKAAVSSATQTIASGVIGFRLNNPFNVERGDNWQGLAAEQLHDRFATFVSMPYGIRAWHKIMQTYKNKYGITTVRGIINRFNPVADDQPASYIPTVANAMGVSADAVINIMDRATAFALARAMMRVEIGSVAAALVSDSKVNEGLTLAGVA
jgi:hypothetical protein